MNQKSLSHSKKHITAVCAVSLFLISASFVYADSSESAALISPTPKPVEYELPYPGLLPDHPLYFLRAVRDTMQNIFTSNPLKKAEFHLLQADKSVSASVLLSEKQDTLQLAGATAVEAQVHFEKALDFLGNAKTQGLEVNELARKMHLANEKHQETLLLLENGAEKHREEFTKAVQKAQSIEKKVKAFLPEE